MMFGIENSAFTTRRRWLVTGAAGFIGSNLCIYLLKAGQNVVALDNFTTGKKHNIEDIELAAESLAGSNFTFIEGDICDFEVCKDAAQGVDFVLHQAALGSVPRSIATPLISHKANVDGFLNMIQASRENGVKKFVYASSSSVYGDSTELPKVESKTGALLSPYAATKAINEVYAAVYQKTYAMQCIGLRYFNVFGPRQDPNGPYAAVIPKWLSALLTGSPVVINGDGMTSRDFCFIENVVQANLRAAMCETQFEKAEVFNVAFGAQTTLQELARELRYSLAAAMARPPESFTSIIEHRDFRAGDVLHSLANTDKAKTKLGYVPSHSLQTGLEITCKWYFDNQSRL